MTLQPTELPWRRRKQIVEETARAVLADGRTRTTYELVKDVTARLDWPQSIVKTDIVRMAPHVAYARKSGQTFDRNGRTYERWEWSAPAEPAKPTAPAEPPWRVVWVDLVERGEEELAARLALIYRPPADPWTIQPEGTDAG